MTEKIRNLSIACIFIALPHGALAQSQASSGAKQLTRPAMVSDSIGMVQVGTPATFSPDGKEFVVVTRRGNLAKNTNDFSLLLFHSARVVRLARREVLLTLSSGSNNPAISNVRWLGDSKTIVFLGENPGQKKQIFSLNIKTRKLLQLTRHPTDILAFDATVDLRTIVYLARQPVMSIFDQTSRTAGVVVSEQNLADLLVGHNSENLWRSPAELFLIDGKRTQRIVFNNPEIPVVQAGVSLSPDGRFAIILTNTHLYPPPASWKEYRLPVVGTNQTDFIAGLLIDVQTRSIRVLNNAPADALGGFAWSADGKSVVVSDSYLTLDTGDISERESRKTTRWVVEVDAKRNQPTKIVQVKEGNDYELLNWDLTTNTVFLRLRTDTVVAHSSANQATNELLAYRKSQDQWERVDPAVASSKSRRRFDVREEQDLNTPPHLVVVDHKTGGKSLFLDLNPQFRSLRFGHVEEITWRGTDGTQARAGLYLPPDFVVGQKYPLVIQTHGWSSDQFSIDGLSTAGYAAQVLAGKEFVVAQVGLAEDLDSTFEGPRNMAMFEGLIDALDSRRLVDRNRVGLLGWSRTGYHVRYTLAFCNYPVTAAVVVDGMDGGYWQYLAEGAFAGNTFEAQNGAAPFGRGLHAWLDHAPSFNLDRVHTPVRLLGFGPYWFDYSWEWFVGLKRLGKPVEMIWIPDALHAPVKPAERMTAQQGDVDWFCFWLKGEEDPDPAKAEQYARWRELRKLQQENEKRAAQEPN